MRRRSTRDRPITRLPLSSTGSTRFRCYRQGKHFCDCCAFLWLFPFGASIDTKNSFDRLLAQEVSMALSRSISALIVLLWVCVPLFAQWQHYPTPGIPRTPDGKPDLSAPAPKTPDGKPDLSGVWTVRNGNKYFQDLGADGVEIPMLPSAKALYEQRQEKLKKGNPSERSLRHRVKGLDDVDAATQID